MRFKIISTGYDYLEKDLALKIITHSKSAVVNQHFNIINKEKLINFEESFIVLYTDARILPEGYLQTDLKAFRHRLLLSFNLNDIINDKNINAINYKNSMMPHDFYQIFHSPNGSMWLMANELFYNKTCDRFLHPINFFNSSSMRWASRKFFNQYKNFNNCTIDTGTGDLFDSATKVDIHELIKTNAFKNSIIKVFGKKYDLQFQDRPLLVETVYKRIKTTFNKTVSKTLQLHRDAAKVM